jgi:spermidine synthase
MSKPGRSKLLEFASPWFFSSGIIRTFACEELSRADILLHIYRDEFSRPYILETTRERRLQFTCGATQSVMSLEDPDALVTAYARKMMAFLLFNSNPKHILMIGLGGGSLAKFCYRHLPNTRLTVVEINEDVIALRDQFRIPPDDPRFEVIHDDGARYMEALRSKVDVVLVDAFDATGIATSLPQSNFYPCAATQLSREGLLVMNFSGRGDRYADNIRALRGAFRNRMVLVPVEDDENLVLFAMKRPVPRAITPELDSTAKRLQKELQLEFPRYLRKICTAYRRSRSR